MQGNQKKLSDLCRAFEQALIENGYGEDCLKVSGIFTAYKAVYEILKHEWALKLRSFFFDADKRKKELMGKGEYFSDQEIKDYFTRFLEILDMGDAEYQQAIEGKQRIVRFNEEKCLLKRLREYVSEHLRYMSVPKVPRGNNGAERSAKEAKRKVRISGGFRSDKGADNYARVTSVVSTMNKQKMSIFQGIKDIFNGKTLVFNSNFQIPANHSTAPCKPVAR